MRTFKAKLSCVNCGFEDFYRFPYKSDIQPFRPENDEDSMVEIEGRERTLNCMNCGLPYLLGAGFWEPTDKYGLRQSDGTSETSSA